MRYFYSFEYRISAHTVTSTETTLFSREKRSGNCLCLWLSYHSSAALWFALNPLCSLVSLPWHRLDIILSTANNAFTHHHQYVSSIFYSISVSLFSLDMNITIMSLQLLWLTWRTFHSKCGCNFFSVETNINCLTLHTKNIRQSITRKEIQNDV